MLYQIIVYVPTTHTEAIKNAIFDAGAGRYEQYDRCSWQTQGSGQFRGLEGSHPAIGIQGNLEYVEEMKIETVCVKENLKKVLIALKKAHPYEEPAYGVIELKTIEDF